MQMNMIEKAAKALSGADDPHGIQWYGVNPDYWDKLARVAIETMQGAVPVVREQGELVHELRGSPSAIWATMFEAALSPGQQPPQEK